MLDWVVMSRAVEEGKEGTASQKEQRTVESRERTESERTARVATWEP